MFKTVKSESQSIIIEKKSKFIGNLYYVENEEEANEILNNIKKKYFDARHNCYAYRIIKDGTIIEKQSDDGEPAGTAGMPMLNILAKQNIVNVLIVVTRYFGGILLGTGGLVKAYSDATKDALQNTEIIEKQEGYVIELMCDYENIRQFEYICLKNNIKIVSKEYAESIKVLVEIPKAKMNNFIEKNLKSNFQNIPIKIIKEKFI